MTTDLPPPGISLREGHTVVVTGAGAGLGKGIALAFAAEGARVVIAARGDNGEQTAAIVRERGGTAIAVRCDVTDAEAVERMVARTVAEYGRIDSIVHNAVAAQSSDLVSLEDSSADLWHAHAAVSLRGSYYLARAALPHLIASRGNLTLLTSSTASEGSGPMPLYAAVKAGIRGLMKSLAKEWGPLGVRVNAVSPLVMSDALKRFFDPATNPGHEERLRGIVPLGYIGEPEPDVAPPFLFLASDAAHYVHGQVLTVDGGRFM